LATAFAVLATGPAGMPEESGSFMDWLEKSINEHDIGTISILDMSGFDPLSSHARYKALLRRMNLEH
jgi:hypothetical protein